MIAIHDEAPSLGLAKSAHWRMLRFTFLELCFNLIKKNMHVYRGYFWYKPLYYAIYQLTLSLQSVPNITRAFYSAFYHNQ